MRTILKIMTTELKVLFYSPIAWLIIIVFAFQAGAEFSSLLAGQVRSINLGYGVYGATNNVLSGYGVFSQMLGNLYLYIPLLTMGLMSRELSSGSIKLLYSSPVSNAQIIVGKYLSVMVYGFILMLILMIYVVIGYFSIVDMDLPTVLTAMIGIYLTVCAYSAIGLFMSTITQYQVVAAIGTLVVLAILNYVGKMGQDISFVRDITYWLSISGRSEAFLSGLMSSTDVIYFILVVLLFLAMSIIKLQGERLKVSKVQNVAKYGSVIVTVLVLGYISSRPMMIKYYDATFNKRNTLTRESQDVVAMLDGGLKITTYVNFLDNNYHKGAPSFVNSDKAGFSKYVRFKPEIEMEYVYYYDTVYNAVLDKIYPSLNTEQRFDTLCKIYDYDRASFKSPKQIRELINLADEGNTFVRLLERENGNKTFLRIYNDQNCDPSESEITSALKSIAVKSPKVGFVMGHSERSVDGIGDRSFGTFATTKSFRHSLVNQGFRVDTLNLSGPVDEDIDILVISDMRSPYSETEMANYNSFLARGGNMIILGEPRRQDNMNPLISNFGLKFADGVLVEPIENRPSDLMVGKFTNFALNIRGLAGMISKGNCITMPTSCGIETIAKSPFTVEPLVVTSEKGVWNEMKTSNFIDQTPTCDIADGEVEKSYDLMVLLKRYINGKDQRIFVIADADCISNGEISVTRKGISAANYSLIIAMFQELSYGEFPITTTKVHPRDNNLTINSKNMDWIEIAVKWVFPLLLVISYLLIWYIRRGR